MTSAGTTDLSIGSVLLAACFAFDLMQALHLWSLAGLDHWMFASLATWAMMSSLGWAILECQILVVFVSFSRDRVGYSSTLSFAWALPLIMLLFCESHHIFCETIVVWYQALDFIFGFRCNQHMVDRSLFSPFLFCLHSDPGSWVCGWLTGVDASWPLSGGAMPSSWYPCHHPHRRSCLVRSSVHPSRPMGCLLVGPPGRRTRSPPSRLGS